MAIIKSFAFQPLYKLENGCVKEIYGKIVYEYTDKVINSFPGRQIILEMDGGNIRKFAGHYEYTVDGNVFKKYNGIILYKYEDGYIKDFYFRQLLRVDGNISQMEFAIICLKLENRL